MATVTIIGAGMMGSGMCRPARDNGHEVRLVGTPLDRDIIDEARAHRLAHHPEAPAARGRQLLSDRRGVDGTAGADGHLRRRRNRLEWFAESILPVLPLDVPVPAVTKACLVRRMAR